MTDDFPYKCIMYDSTCYKQSGFMSDVKGIMFSCSPFGASNLKRYVQPSKQDEHYDDILKKIGKCTTYTDLNNHFSERGFTFWIGRFADGTVGTVQTLPLRYRGWGSGSCDIDGITQSANDNWIQCIIMGGIIEDDCYWSMVVQEMIKLSEYVCDQCNLDPLGYVQKGDVNLPVILSRNEAYAVKYAYNLDDPKYTSCMNVETIRNKVSDNMKARKHAPYYVQSDILNKVFSVPDINSDVGKKLVELETRQMESEECIDKQDVMNICLTNMQNLIRDISHLQLSVPKKHLCNACKYYEGVHNVNGHAPCAFWNIGGVLATDFCSRWEPYNLNNKKEV